MRLSAKRWQTVAGSQQLTAQVSPGWPDEPNLRAVITSDIGRVGQAGELPRIEQIGRQRLDPVLPQPFGQFRPAEAGDADDAAFDSCRLRRPGGHAGERRPHLAADAQNQQIAVETAERFDDARRRLAEQVVEDFGGCDAVGVGHGVTTVVARIRHSSSSSSSIELPEDEDDDENERRSCEPVG